SVLVVNRKMPVLQRFPDNPETHFVESSWIFWMNPPGQMKKVRELHQVIVNVCEDNFELLVAILTRESNPLHAEIDR
ncbi:hypothetical protein, partial [Nevskia ramosa]|uniref:hypothetical protein n=1 Tax=Nevskia ramosa TaxID=64002 RepID=UPI0023558CB6